jgi:hypothetical protein
MLFGLGSLLLWFLYRAGTPRHQPLDVHPVRVALCFFLLSVGVTYVMTMAGPINSDEVSPADVALIAVASWTGTLLVVHDGITTRARLDTLVWRLAVCGGLIAMIGIVQVLTGQAWVDRVTIPGLTATETTGLASRGAFARPAGTAIHPIEYGVLRTMLLPLALHVAFHHVWRRRARWVPALVLIAAIPLTSSRSAYLGAAIGVTICMLGWPARQRLGVGMLALGGVVSMFVVTPNLFKSIIGLFSGASEDPSITSRTGSFDMAAEFLSRAPLFGRGLGTFLPRYRIFDNQYLVLLVTVGIVGTAAFLALGVTAVVTLVRLLRTLRAARDRDLATTLVAALAVGYVSLALFDAFAFPMTMGTLFLLLGSAGALRRLCRTTRGQESARPRPARTPGGGNPPSALHRTG